MKKNDLKTVCDSALKNELGKRGYFVQRIPKNINDWKHLNKIIEFEAEHEYWYLGETKEFTKDSFEQKIREFLLSISNDDEIEIHKEYFKLESHTLVATELVKCQKEDKEAIEFWGIYNTIIPSSVRNKKIEGDY